MTEQREIKFRGLDGNGQWAYGSLINNMWTFSELTERSGQNVCEIITGKYDSDNWQEAIEEETNLISVRPETVGQYTGLKDKNGKEIYEGDVIKQGAYISVVKFENGSFTWCDEPIGYECEILPFEKYSTEKWAHVIGNLHENPELIP